MFSVVVAVIGWSTIRYAASSLSINRCNPANHICQGRCPPVPFHAPLPPPENPEGLCLMDYATEACVCWLWNPTTDTHLQTLFKCEVSLNSTQKHTMCLPPTFCFPPGEEPGCLIVPHCPCTRYTRGTSYGQWTRVIAFILRSNTPVKPEEKLPTVVEETPTEKPTSESREFSIKHLLFLLAFVIAPLLCWCLLTFFHEGKCRRKTRSPECEPMPTTRCEDITEEPPLPAPCLMPLHPPTAPKFESPPPYLETVDVTDHSLLAADCGPPPSYEDAIKDQWQLMLVHRVQEPDSDEPTSS